MKKLQVPENISLNGELWPGFGLPEGIKTLVVASATLLLTILYCVLTSPPSPSLIIVISLMVSLAVGVGLFQKMEHNQSIYSFFMRQLAYRNEQQKFLYHRKEGEWHLEEKD